VSTNVIGGTIEMLRAEVQLTSAMTSIVNARLELDSCDIQRIVPAMWMQEA
jgi:hypothetical protein